MQFPIPPIMTSLPKLVDTYINVCGSHNPFAGAPGMDPAAYGIDPGALHQFMIALHGDLPVMDNYNKLAAQINYTLAANAEKYAAIYAARTKLSALVPGSDYAFTDTASHTGTITDGKAGTETNTRNGAIADSGTDTTSSDSANPPTATDSVKTYDAGTFKEVNKSVQTGATSLTHGKTTTYTNLADVTSFDNRLDTRTYADTITHTVNGYKNDPSKLLSAYADFARNNNVFMEIINDVLRAISCIVYIPMSHDNEMEE